MAFLTSVIEKSTPSSVIQVKNRRKTMRVEKKLAVIRQLKKAERIVFICRNVRLVRISVQTVRDNANRITENQDSGTEVLCSKTTTVLSARTYQKLRVSLTYLLQYK